MTSDLQRLKRAANARRRYRMKKLGTWQPYIDTKPIRAHVIRINNETGLAYHRIGELSGAGRDTIRWLIWGDPSRGLRPQRKISPEKAALLLKFWPDLDQLPGTALIKSTGTVRRLQACAVAGFGRPYIAARLGVGRRWFDGIIHRDTVTVRIARNVRDLYAELRGQEPPSDTAGNRIAAGRAAAHAARQGWLPHQAWDDDTIDDPHAKPWQHLRCSHAGCRRGSHDERILCKAHLKALKDKGTLDGVQTIRNGNDLVEDANWVMRTDRLETEGGHIDLHLVAERLEVTFEALDRALDRHADQLEQVGA